MNPPTPPNSSPSLFVGSVRCLKETGKPHPRNRRSKGQAVSELDSIKGVGEKTRTALLSHFKSVKRLREADIDTIAEVIGPAKASIVYGALHDS